MRRVLALILPLLIVGCQGGDASNRVAPVVTTPVSTVPEPKTSEATGIALIRQGHLVNVGMRPDDAFKVFVGPRENGLDVKQLPPGFSEPYAARWWEGAGRGFGVVTYNGSVVAAMYQEEHTDPERMSEFVKTYQNLMGNLVPTTYGGNRVSYWFWSKDGQRLMVCAFRTETEGIDVTTAMGDEVVLDALGISPKRAQFTVDRIEDLLSRPNPPKGSPK